MSVKLRLQKLLKQSEQLQLAGTGPWGRHLKETREALREALGTIAALEAERDELVLVVAASESASQMFANKFFRLRAAQQQGDDDAG